MSNNTDPTRGGGPWRLELDEPLSPGDWVEFDLKRMEYRGQKGYFVQWLPMDSLLIKNLDTGNPIDATINGQFEAHVEPNAADEYGDVQVNRLRLRNAGGSDIATEDLIIQLSKEPYDADDRALEEKQRPPLERVARSVIGL